MEGETKYRKRFMEIFTTPLSRREASQPSAITGRGGRIACQIIGGELGRRCQEGRWKENMTSTLCKMERILVTSWECAYLMERESSKKSHWTSRPNPRVQSANDGAPSRRREKTEEGTRGGDAICQPTEPSINPHDI